MNLRETSLTPVRVSALLDALNEVEERFPVLEWRVGGVQIWPSVRIAWFFAQWESEYCTPPSSGGILPIGRTWRYFARLAEGLFGYTRACIGDWRAQDSVRDSRDAVFLSDGSSFVINRGMRYERFCDPLIEALQARKLTTLLLTPSHLYLRPRATASVFVQPQLDIAIFSAALLGSRWRDTAQLPQNAELRAVMAERDLDHPVLSEQRIIAAAARILSMAAVYERILSKVSPRLAFIVDYYNPSGMAFVLACRRRGIRAVDIQHGVQGELNPAYGRFPNSPINGFDLVPHSFWVWSEVEAQSIRNWAGNAGAHRVVVGGNPWLDVWLAGCSQFVIEADQVVREMHAAAGGRKIALVTLQWGLSDAEQILPLLEIIRHAGEGWLWWVRKHPVMVVRGETVHSDLCQESGRVVIDKPSELPLYALLRHVDVHLTHSSTTVIEAANFGVASLVTGQLGVELFPDHIKNGTAKFAEGTIDRKIAALNAQAARRRSVERAPLRGDISLDSLLREAQFDSRSVA